MNSVEYHPHSSLEATQPWYATDAIILTLMKSAGVINMVSAARAEYRRIRYCAHADGLGDRPRLRDVIC